MVLRIRVVLAFPNATTTLRKSLMPCNKSPRKDVSVAQRPPKECIVRTREVAVTLWVNHDGVEQVGGRDVCASGAERVQERCLDSDRDRRHG